MNKINSEKAYKIAENWVRTFPMEVVDEMVQDDFRYGYMMTDGSHTIIAELFGDVILRENTELGWVEAKVENAGDEFIFDLPAMVEVIA